MRCRHCESTDLQNFVDLGSAPPSNAMLTEETLKKAEVWYPLRVLACRSCRLVQTDDYVSFDTLFNEDYTYFSSYSKAWLDHSFKFANEAIDSFKLTSGSFVVEVAANDGYLLQYFRDREIRCLGVEPTASTARVARSKGIEIVEEFFGADLGRRLREVHGPADLIVANNVLAHVPDINDFVSGFSELLSSDGVASFEFPWLLNLIRLGQFDTIYHEHFSYLSLFAVERVLNKAGLTAFDAQFISTHGGSLRVLAHKSSGGRQRQSASLESIRQQEMAAGIDEDRLYTDFQRRADDIKNDLVSFLIQAKCDGKRVIGYGAAAKGNTLLNYGGVRPDLIGRVVDRSVAKQGRYLPGSRIPVVNETVIKTERPDFVLVLPWNLKEEIMSQLSYVREWNAKFVVAVPRLLVE